MFNNPIAQIAIVAVIAFVACRKSDERKAQNDAHIAQYGNNYSEGSKFPGVIYLIIAGVAYVLFKKATGGGL